MTTIIVPLDGSAAVERSLGVARSLARRADASVILFTDRESGIREDLDDYFDAQSARFDLHAEHRTSTSHDVPGELAEIASAHSDALIVMASHGPSGLKDAVIGSVTAETIRASASPVLLVGPHLSATPAVGLCYDTIIVCIDGSTTSEAVVPIVAHWARLLRAKVRVVQVVDPSSLMAVDSDVSHEAVNEIAYVSRIAHQFGVSGILADYDVLHNEHPAVAIVEASNTASTPIIAMATHGRTGLRRLVMGSVSMAVVRHATCPVMVVRAHDPADAAE